MVRFARVVSAIVIGVFVVRGRLEVMPRLRRVSKKELSRDTVRYPRRHICAPNWTSAVAWAGVFVYARPSNDSNDSTAPLGFSYTSKNLTNTLSTSFACVIMATMLLEPSMSTSAMRASLHAADAPSMADSLPNINFGFDDLRDRMARFTERFDAFIAKGRKQVLEERNRFRINVAELQGTHDPGQVTVNITLTHPIRGPASQD